MRRIADRSRGFVFLATLGVMAVAILLVFATSGTVQYSYGLTSLSLGHVQEQVMARSAADYALLLIAQKQMAVDGKPRGFMIVSDQARKITVTGEVTATQTSADHQVYKTTGLAHRPGDVLIHVASAQLRERYGRGDRWLLCNLVGKRVRPIDVTAALRRTVAREAAKTD